jgi:hypothetical protein
VSFPLSVPGRGDPPPLDRASWESLVRAARAWQRDRGAADAPDYTRQTSVPQTLVQVRNDTGAALAAFSVLKLGPPLISASNAPHELRLTPVFQGAAPDNYADGFCVLIEPAPDGAVARAAVLGVVPCDVLINNVGDGWAAPENSGIVTGTGTAALSSRPDGGPAKILWRATEATGVRRCVVLLQGDMGAGAGPPVSPPLSPPTPPSPAGPDCAGCGWVAALTADSCLSATLIQAGGACDCEDTVTGLPIRLVSFDGVTWPSGSGTVTICGTAYTVSFTKEGCDGPCLTLTSADLAGNCPDCPQPPARQYRLTFEGGDEDFRGVRGEWTFTAEDECYWTGTKGSAFGEWAGSITIHYTGVNQYRVSGSFTKSGTGGAVYFTISDSSAPATTCCGPFGVFVEEYQGIGEPPTAASGVTPVAPCPGVPSATYTATRDCCGPDYAIFSVGVPAVCTGDPADDGRPSSNVARIRVDWTRCAGAPAAFTPAPSQYTQDVGPNQTISIPIQVTAVSPGTGPSFFQMALDVGTTAISQFIASLVSPAGAVYALFTQPSGITTAQMQATLQPVATAPRGTIQTHTQSSGPVLGQFQAQANFGVVQSQPNGVWTLRLQNTGTSTVAAPVQFAQLTFGALPSTGLSLTTPDPGDQTAGVPFQMPSVTIGGLTGDHGYLSIDPGNGQVYLTPIRDPVFPQLTYGTPGTYSIVVRATDMDGRKYGEDEGPTFTVTAPTVSACGCPAVPTVLSLTIGGSVGAGTYPLTYDASGVDGAGWYTANITVGMNTGYYRWWCDAGTWKLTSSCTGGGGGTASAFGVTCSPFSASGTAAGGGACTDFLPSFTVGE